jgi:hypothetical protein
MAGKCGAPLSWAAVSGARGRGRSASAASGPRLAAALAVRAVQNQERSSALMRRSWKTRSTSCAQSLHQIAKHLYLERTLPKDCLHAWVHA